MQYATADVQDSSELLRQAERAHAGAGDNPEQRRIHKVRAWQIESESEKIQKQ
jgi:hypothetical protein